MYPRNAASPERIAVGAVVQISDGAVQSSGVSIAVVPQGGASGAGGGTTSYDNGIVLYVPTQAETNYASFVVTAYKTGCIPVAQTIVTSASAVAGYAAPDWAVIRAPTTTVNLSGTTIATTQKVDVETIKTQAVTAAAGVTFPTSIASPTNITAGTITTVTNLTNAPTAGDFTATMKTSIGTAVAASAVASVTGNVGGNVLGSVASIAANGIAAASIATGAFTSTKFAAGAIDAAALATDAVDEIRDGVWAKTQAELTGDPGATPTALQSIALTYMAIRNKRDTDSGLGTDEIHNSAGSVILTASITDAAGVYSKAKYA